MSVLDHFEFKDSSLTESQQKAYKELLSGKSIFLTGAAGCGKTFLLEKYYNDAIKKHGVTKVFKTSTTGISALNIGGRTIHSFMGIGLGTDKLEYLIKNMRPASIKRIQSTRVLFIDEISMLNPDILDKIYKLFVHFKSAETFRDPETGLPERLNVQFVLTGDLYQLLPVKSEKQCFEAEHWKDMVQNVVILTDIVRQKSPEFQTLLTEIRIGVVSEKTIEILNSRIGVQLVNEYGIKPTVLFPTNNSVDLMNNKKLSELIESGAENHKYIASYKTIYNNTTMKPETLREEIKRNSVIPDELTLAVGAQVIFKKNISETIVNGTRGVISSFVVIKPSTKPVPVVTLITGETFMCEPTEFKHSVKPDYEIIRTQVPIKLAYATSVHGSQGSTIDLLEIDIGNKIFDYGQSYVALSRCRTLEGLTIKAFDPTKVVVNPKVERFYNSYKKM